MNKKGSKILEENNIFLIENLVYSLFNKNFFDFLKLCRYSRFEYS